MASNKVRVYIEIEKHTNIKYEYDKTRQELVVDRILEYPYFYPYAYGFIPDTLADDDDDLDILLITDDSIRITKDTYYDAYIIGALKMEDEKGMDEKLLCVLEPDKGEIEDINDISDSVKENIEWFFSNYKTKDYDKWSRTMGFMGRDEAVALYNKCRILMN